MQLEVWKSFSISCMMLSRYMLNKNGKRTHSEKILLLSWRISRYCYFRTALIESFVQSFNDLNDIVICVIVPHHLPQSFMSILIKGLPKVVLGVTLVMQVIFDQQCTDVLLFGLNPVCSSARTYSFFPFSILRKTLLGWLVRPMVL